MNKTRLLCALGLMLACGLAFVYSGPPAGEQVVGDLGQALDRYMKRAEANGYSGSALVARGGQVILAKGYGWADREKKIPETEATVYSIGSITKQFTGAAILKLEARGKLSVSDSIAKYFKDVPPDKVKVTLHQLLTHTAGFTDAVGDDYDVTGRDEFIRLAMGSKLRFEPGSRYQYSNVGYSLLGIIVELVSGQGYEEYLQENLFRPAGMTRTGYLLPKFDKRDLAVGYRNEERWGSALDRPWLPDGPGWHLRANGGILSTVADMHRWYLALKSNLIFPETVRAKYFAPHVREFPDGPSYYGYGWVTQKSSTGSTLVHHNGGNGIYNAFMGFDLENDLVFIVSCNVSGKRSDDYALRMLEIATGQYRPLDEKILAARAGTYLLGAGEEMAVAFNENDTLRISFTSGTLVPLLSGSGKEKSEETAACDRKTKKMISDALAGDYAALAAGWGEPLEPVRARASNYWGGMKKRLGEVKILDVLGTVDRPAAWLTYTRVDFEKGTRFFTCVWEKDGGLMSDLRESDGLERDFEPVSESKFRQPLIDASIVFEKDASGRTVMVITKGGKVSRAVMR